MQLSMFWSWQQRLVFHKKKIFTSDFISHACLWPWPCIDWKKCVCVCTYVYFSLQIVSRSQPPFHTYQIPALFNKLRTIRVTSFDAKFGYVSFVLDRVIQNGSIIPAVWNHNLKILLKIIVACYNSLPHEVACSEMLEEKNTDKNKNLYQNVPNANCIWRII